jgi:5-methylcytosine-specific restriction endonuclease McrA
VNPFVYPKSQYLRREKPGLLSAYPQYKPFLQREFERKCVYCRMPDSLKDYELYGVDQYRPKSRFPQLVTSYSNLFYCCNPCNRRKGEYWPAKGKGQTHFIPNPCDHEMFKHLRFNRAVVETKSTAGEVAESLLDLNDPETVAYRNFVLDALNTYAAKKIVLEQTHAQLTKLRDEGSISVADADTALLTLKRDLAQVTATLNRLAGQ